MSGTIPRPREGVASRILALLGVFDTTHRRLSLTEISRRAELPLSTVHRMVAELEGWGALSRQPCGGYVIGRRLWDVGLLAPAPTGLLEVASPFLHDLYGATLATVHLVVRLRIELVERLASPSNFGDDVLGGSFPDEWLGIVVPVVCPGGDRGGEIGDAGERSAA
jgi:DNA-binding IclR family transcriptional regulator